MYPNEKYFEHFPQTVDKVEPTEENSLRSCALEIGSFIVIDKIIKHYKLDKIASDWFGKDAGLFLDLAAYMIVTEDNVGQYYPGTHSTILCLPKECVWSATLRSRAFSPR